MKEQINEEMLEDITGGAITFHWSAKEQKGTVSSNITGQTFSFGREQYSAVRNYVRSHIYDSDESQMNALKAIIGG